MIRREKYGSGPTPRQYSGLPSYRLCWEPQLFLLRCDSFCPNRKKLLPEADCEPGLRWRGKNDRIADKHFWPDGFCPDGKAAVTMHNLHRERINI